jgi:hypothetical protein
MSVHTELKPSKNHLHFKKQVFILANEYDAVVGKIVFEKDVDVKRVNKLF